MNATEMTEAYNDIISRPVTRFTAICRAIEMAHAQRFGVQEIADALSDALETIQDNDGYLPTKEF